MDIIYINYLKSGIIIFFMSSPASHYCCFDGKLLKSLIDKLIAKKHKISSAVILRFGQYKNEVYFFLCFHYQILNYFAVNTFFKSFSYYLYKFQYL